MISNRRVPLTHGEPNQDESKRGRKWNITDVRDVQQMLDILYVSYKFDLINNRCYKVSLRP